MTGSIFIIQKTKSNISKDRTLIITSIILLFNVGQHRENKNLIHLQRLDEKHLALFRFSPGGGEIDGPRDNALTKCS